MVKKLVDSQFRKSLSGWFNGTIVLENLKKFTEKACDGSGFSKDVEQDLQLHQKRESIAGVFRTSCSEVAPLGLSHSFKGAL